MSSSTGTNVTTAGIVILALVSGGLKIAKCQLCAVERSRPASTSSLPAPVVESERLIDMALSARDAGDGAGYLSGMLEACDHHEPLACAAAGIALVLGDGVPADVPRGSRLLSSGCEANVGEACYFLGLVKREHGIEHDDADALIRKACTLGVAVACAPTRDPGAPEPTA